MPDHATPGERDLVNTTAHPGLWGGEADPPCLLDSLRRTAAARPEAVAIEDGSLEVTYVRLLEWAHAIADLLAVNGIAAQDRVAVTGPRGAPVVAALLGVAILGATYVPLDAEYPVKRLTHMLQDSGAKVVLYDGKRPFLDQGVPSLQIPESDPTGASTGRPPAACRPELPVYVIYTSGSTGWPKGVAIPHSCLDNMVEWQVHRSIRPDLRTTQFAPLNFDVCFQEILGTLCGGGTLVIVPEPLRRDPFTLRDWLADNRIERLFLPYVALQMLAVAVSEETSAAPLRLVEVNTAGEQVVCTPAIRELFRAMPGCRLNNHYGQSESAMVTSHIMEGPSSDWPTLPPIGVPLPGCELLIRHLDDLTEATVGELLVAGLPVSLGYLGHPELNAERFIAIDPTPQGHTKAFRTGDLVRFDGEVVHFVGRVDHEVKVRGFRVNPVEVDAWLLDQPGVLEAVCVAVETGTASRHLRAAVTLKDESAPPDLDAMRNRLAEVLPASSVPQSIHVLAELPRAPSGKIDREEVKRRLMTGPQ